MKNATRIWKIVSSAGQNLGNYEGATPEDALDALARDAGYANEEEAAKVGGAFEGSVTCTFEVKTPG